MGPSLYPIYPSNRVVNYAYDSAAHPLSALDANGAQYISNATYWPSGSQYQTWRPNIYLRTDLNKRLQIAGFYSDNGQVGSFYLNKTYNYGAQNNGNIMSIVNNKDPNRTENFSYDALNRITAGWTNGSTGALSWGENYTIDAWGNLMMSPMVSKAHGGTWQCAGDANNRANCLSYDAAGNVTANGGAGYTYDAENRLASAGGMTYAYDADGNRVKKSSGSTGTLYWYASPGIIAESDLAGNIQHEYVFFGGKRVARIDQPGSSVHYYLSDHLGSTSMVVSSAGTPEEESDYSPFGTEYVLTGPGVNRYKYTGHERDSESGLDYYGARYYGSALGRFTSIDPITATPVHLINPQRWNMYAYGMNNPLFYVDPDGRDAIAVNLVSEVPLGGHEGIIVVHSDGSATYARFGPAGGNKPSGSGKVDTQGLKPVQFNPNGLPTDASYKDLADEVGKIEGQSASTVGFNYFKTSEADSTALENWIKQMQAASDRGQAPQYQFNTQNCATFCIAGLLRANAIKNENLSLIPNRLFMLLAPRAADNYPKQNPKPPKEVVKSRVCDPSGKNCTAWQ